jgi:biofilm PGA synthesis N-glycosyltransferase PgaC
MREYIAITPARDEEKYLPQLIRSMTSQSCRPSCWIIIDDGSTDSSGQIIAEAAAAYPWIQAHHLKHGRKRSPGGESVVMQFLTPRVVEGYPFILRADADTSFEPDMVELLMKEFERDPRLGIAGPVLLEPSSDGWHPQQEPSFHAPGPLKMYLTECFRAIGGLKPGLGWDTIDLMSAQMLGFRTAKFPHIQARHHRPQGASSGSWRNRLSQGYAAYNAGASPFWMLARAVRRSFSSPRLIGGALMLAGYIQGYLCRWPRAASPEVISFTRRQQVRRLLMRETIWR